MEAVAWLCVDCTTVLRFLEEGYPSVQTVDVTDSVPSALRPPLSRSCSFGVVSIHTNMELDDHGPSVEGDEVAMGRHSNDPSANQPISSMQSVTPNPPTRQ